MGGFVAGGETFYVIRPGYDAQGRRRASWTQVVHEDVPIWEHKVDSPATAAIARFESLWAKHIDATVLLPALEATKKARREAFMDGRSGEAPAPTTTRDGKRYGKRYDT